MSAARGGGARSGVLAAAAMAGAALLIAQAVRVAAVVDRHDQPALAAALWPGHPDVLSDGALLAIAQGAARGQPVAAGTRAEMRRVAAKAPLSPQPFLIEAAIAASRGDQAAAERLLLAAKARDPRSRGTRFLLADLYFRTGRVAAGLGEMKVLVGLEGQGGELFVPALTAYARMPGAIAELRQFFAQNQGVEASVLTALAGDARNDALVLALATDSRNPEPDWRAALLSSLATAGEFRKARSIWSRLHRLPPPAGLFNPGFARLDALPPFNWAYPQSAEGVAEPDGRGGLKLLYYGRAPAVLASQLLLLGPGRYQLALSAGGEGEVAGTLHWSLRCATGNKVLADVPLRRGPQAIGFTIPGGCEAQWFEFTGIPGDVPRTNELTVSGLRLAADRGTAP